MDITEIDANWLAANGIKQRPSGYWRSRVRNGVIYTVAFVGGLAVAAGALSVVAPGLLDQTRPAQVATMATVTPQEDSAEWDCRTMGNHVCGPGNPQGVDPGTYMDGQLVPVIPGRETQPEDRVQPTAQPQVPQADTNPEPQQVQVQPQPQVQADPQPQVQAATGGQQLDVGQLLQLLQSAKGGDSASVDQIKGLIAQLDPQTRKELLGLARQACEAIR